MPAKAPVPADDSDATTQRRLIQAAVELFSSRGYDGVSAREIERHAGINRGAAAYHYGTKDELWKAAIDWLFERFQEELSRYQELLPILSPAEQAKVLLRIYGRFGGKYPEFFRFLVIHGTDQSERGKWLVSRLRPSIEFLRRVTGSSDTDSLDVEAMLYFMYSGAVALMFAIPVTSKELFGIDTTDPEVGERYAEAAVNAFLPFFTGEAKFEPATLTSTPEAGGERRTAS